MKNKNINWLYLLAYPAYMLKNIEKTQSQYYIESLYIDFERGAISKCFLDFCINRIYQLSKTL